MKEEADEEELDCNSDENEEQSWPKATKAATPFSNFYLKKSSTSNCSGSLSKLSEQFSNTSIGNVDESLFEFDVVDIPGHKPRLERSEVYRNVRVSHVDEDLSFVSIMLNEDWLIATRMLNDTFEQTLLEKQPHIDILTLKSEGYYMCKSQSSWFRCRLLTKISAIGNEENLVNVHLIDWGMEREVSLADLREMPQSLSRQSICSVRCRLSGVQNGSLASLTTLASCHQLLNYHDYQMRVLGNDLIVLHHNNENINDQIINFLNQNAEMTKEEYLEDEFGHQTILNIGDEHWAILASYRADDDQKNDFYILMSDQTTNEVDRALASIDSQQCNVKEPRSIHPLCVKPRMMVIAPWKNERNGHEQMGYYRAWIRSMDGESCRIVFVDYGNECDIERSKLFSCPSSVASLPWLAIRVRFHQYLSHEEFKRFWFRTDSHWIKVKVSRIDHTHYTVQVFIDYTSVLLHEDRKMHAHGEEKTIRNDPPLKGNPMVKEEDLHLAPTDHSALVLHEIRKKLNQLTEKIDANQKKNDEGYQHLLEQIAHQ